MTRRRALNDEQRAVIIGHLTAGTRTCLSLAAEYRVNVSTIYVLKPAGLRIKRQPPSDLTGRRFGSWTVLHKAPPHPTYRNRNAYWVCRCVCDALVPVRTWSLTSGQSTRCPTCRNREVSRRPRKRKKEEF